MKIKFPKNIIIFLSMLVLVTSTDLSLAGDYKYKFIKPSIEKFPREVDRNRVKVFDQILKALVVNSSDTSGDPIPPTIGACNKLLFVQGFEISSMTIEPYNIDSSVANARSLPSELISNEYTVHILVDSDGDAGTANPTPPDDILVRFVFPAPAPPAP